MPKLLSFQLGRSLTKRKSKAGSGGGSQSATQAMRTAMLADNPIVIFGLDEYTGAGNLAESTSGGRSLTLQSTAPAASSEVLGIKCVTFAADGYFANGSQFTALRDITNGLSIEYLFRPTSSSTGIFNFTNGTNGSRRIGSLTKSTRFHGYELRNSGGGNVDGTPEGDFFLYQLAINKWHHLVITFRLSGGQFIVTMYVNGAYYTETTITSSNFTVDNTRNFITLGGQGNFTACTGNIANFGVYGSELSAARVLAHYQAIGLNLAA